MCVHIPDHMCVSTCEHVYALWAVEGIFPDHSPLYLLRQSLSLNPKLSGLSNQVRQLPSEIHCLPYQALRLRGTVIATQLSKLFLLIFMSVLTELMPVYTLCVPGV